eukprot:TRINITY_DN33716_c0_g1_i1.p1 TRINITY_DN33716_c0_g1~~TRINITY_DN33716_c0_g1_i1.p1  ORF type:complete len:526 (+),score=89.64 TRINITY_DN33716_c0_g1_i1:131-1708(+)
MGLLVRLSEKCFPCFERRGRDVPHRAESDLPNSSCSKSREPSCYQDAIALTSTSVKTHAETREFHYSSSVLPSHVAVALVVASVMIGSRTTEERLRAEYDVTSLNMSLPTRLEQAMPSRAALRLPWLQNEENNQGNGETERWNLQLRSDWDSNNGVVVVRPAYGLGNRLLSVASAAALGLALNKSLLVLWEDPAFHSVIEAEGITRSEGTFAMLDKVGAAHLDLRGKAIDFFANADLLACNAEAAAHASLAPPDALLRMSETPDVLASRVLHVTSDQFFLPLLQLGRGGGRRARLAVALGDAGAEGAESAEAGDAAAPELARWTRRLLRGLFRWTPQFREVVESEAIRLFGESSHVIGVHARTKMYPFERTMVPTLSVADLIGCTEVALESAPATALVFLATPSDEVKASFREHFGDRLRTRENIEVDRHAPEGDAEAAVDLALLAASDALVTSVRSTFGYVAQSLAGVRPFVVASATSGGLRCRRPAESTPCFHLGAEIADRLSCGPPAASLREPLAPWAHCWF